MILSITCLTSCLFNDRPYEFVLFIAIDEFVPDLDEGFTGYYLAYCLQTDLVSSLNENSMK